MKSNLSIIVTMILMSSLFFANQGFAQEKTKNYKEVNIQTSAVCGMCKERIETNMSFEKGVKKVELDSDTKIVTIGYDPRKTDADKLRTAISKIGYDADDVKADPVAYEKLPACCKKDHASH